jgi:VDE lipocalin domain
MKTVRIGITARGGSLLLQLLVVVVAAAVVFNTNRNTTVEAAFQAATYRQRRPFLLLAQQQQGRRPTNSIATSSTHLSLQTKKPFSEDENNNNNNPMEFGWSKQSSSFQTLAVSMALGWSVLTSTCSFGMPTNNNNIAYAAADPTEIVGCLFQKCPVPLAKCVLNPKCLLNVVCINTCTGRPDEIDCQIECGNYFENSVVGEFNKCVVSDMSCVPQQPDNGRYPVPTADVTVPKFNTNFFDGKLYITAGTFVVCCCLLIECGARALMLFYHT